MSDGTLTNDSKQIAEDCDTSFTSVLVDVTLASIVANQSCLHCTEDINVTPNQIFEILSGLDGNSSMGVDGVHSKLSMRLAVDLEFAPIYNFQLFITGGCHT